MKLLLTLICAITLVSCTNDNEGTTNSLPPLTAEGKNTFGCFIDGAAFVPRDKGAWIPPQNPVLYAKYTYIPQGEGDAAGYFFSVNAIDEFTSGHVSIGVTGLSEPLEEGQTYPLSLQQDGNAAARYMYSTSTPHTSIAGAYVYEEHKFETTAEHVGQLTITTIDEVNHIISGTFSFEGLNTSDNSILQVNEGRFDVVYDPNY